VSQSYLRAGVCVFDKLTSVSEIETMIWMDAYWRTCVSIPCVAWILFNTKASVNIARASMKEKLMEDKRETVTRRTASVALTGSMLCISQKKGEWAQQNANLYNHVTVNKRWRSYVDDWKIEQNRIKHDTTKWNRVEHSLSRTLNRVNSPGRRTALTMSLGSGSCANAIS
jgi:hypothetical protein